MEAGAWTWLEVVKLVQQGLLTPLIVGFVLHRLAKRFELAQWRSQKLVEKRIQLYDELAPKLNDVLCYFTFVGRWKEITPVEVVALKRDIDRQLHLAAPLFAPEWFDAGKRFLDTCFETYTGWGYDARLRTTFHERARARGAEWDGSWNARFSSPEEIADVRAVGETYKRFMDVFAEELGVTNQASRRR